MKNYQRLLETYENRLSKTVKQEDWSNANLQAGHLGAIKQYKYIADKNGDLNAAVALTESYLQECIAADDYGRAAFCRAWLSGWMEAETACRLDVLEAKIK
jgi:hypothetical protein